MKAPHKVLMIRPVCFGFNPETEASNRFQNKIPDTIFDERQIHEMAQVEFDNAVSLLEKKGIEVLVFEDTTEPKTPDSIFPNNWFAIVPPNNLYTFPMASKIRADEIRPDITGFLTQRFGYNLDQSLLSNPSAKQYLEGTGSLVFDHKEKMVYCAVSPRSDEALFMKFSKMIGYKPIAFTSYGPEGEVLYHTNVMMCVGENFVIIGLDTIKKSDREKVIRAIENSGKRIISLENEQVYKHFAGNMIQLRSKSGKKFLVMSSSARNSITKIQAQQILVFNDEIISVPVNLIETIGGGSIRCMIAEVFG